MANNSYQPPRNTRRGFLMAGIPVTFAFGASTDRAIAAENGGETGLFPTIQQVAARLERMKARNLELFQLEVLGRTAKGNPIFAARITDSMVSDENKEHVLLSAMHSGLERGGTTCVLSIMSWLLSGDPLAQEILRRQVIVCMPLVSPDGYLPSVRSLGNSVGTDAYSGWTLEGVKEPEKNPEAVALKTIMDRYQPEVITDLHGRDLAFHGNIGVESVESYSNVSLRPFHMEIATQMAKAAEAEGYPTDFLEQDSELLFWGPPLEPIRDKVWVGRSNGYAAIYSYNRYHSIVLAGEISWERSALLRNRRLFQIGNEIWPGEYYPGYPNRVVGSNYYHHLVAYGQTAKQRRQSRVELWSKHGQITLAMGNPPVEGLVVFVCATNPDVARKWLADNTLTAFINRLKENPDFDSKAIEQVIERHPHPEYRGNWGRQANLWVRNAADQSSSGSPIENGLSLRLRIPYPKARIKDLRLNGHPVPASQSEGYTEWVARAYHHVQVNIPPSRTRSEGFFVVTCEYEPSEQRTQGAETGEWPEP